MAELGERPHRHASRAAATDDELTLFKSLGIAVEDLAAAELCVARARERGRRHRGRLLIPLAEIEAARERIADVAIRTPLVRLQAPESPAEIWLKLECLQPIGSFKIRGAANAIRQRRPGAIAGGVLTTSAGNMAQGVAWMAREEGVPATIIAPDHAPQTKLDAIERLGGTVIKVPFERWWQAMEEGAYPGVEGYFVHPVMDDAVMAGNGTIGLELVEELDEIDTVLVPWGGGGLTTGIASALAAAEPRDAGVRVRARDGGAARRVARRRRARRGRLHAVVRRRRRQQGAAARRCGSGPGRCSQARSPLTLDETAAAVRLLAERARVIAEGAGALVGRRRALGPRRRGTDRLHRLRRQHRRRPACGDPRGPHARPDDREAGRRMRTISLTALRRLVIAAQGYATRSRTGTTVARWRQAIRRLSCVQLDSISAVERSHRIALDVPRRRLPARHGPAAARPGPRVRVLGARGLPAAGRGLAALRLADAAGAAAAGTATSARRTRISPRRSSPRSAPRGPLGSRHFEGTSEGGMWNWKPAKAMLDRLWNHGDLVIAGRQGFQRLYDLPERVIPRHVLDGPGPGEPERLRALVLQGRRTPAGR